jgi:hypothetical protein
MSPVVEYCVTFIVMHEAFSRFVVAYAVLRRILVK